jgi:hypothetical protein
MPEPLSASFGKHLENSKGRAWFALLQATKLEDDSILGRITKVAAIEKSSDEQHSERRFSVPRIICVAA